MDLEAAAQKLAEDEMDLRGRYRRSERELSEYIEVVHGEYHRLEEDMKLLGSMLGEISDAYWTAYPEGKESGSKEAVYRLLGALNKVDRQLGDMMSRTRGGT